MHDLFEGAAKLTVGASLAGLTVAAITADAILPAFSIAAGVAVGVIYLWQTPVRAQITFLTEQMDWLKNRLNREIEEHDRTREKVSIAREALAEAGIRLKHLEDDGPSVANADSASQL